MNTFSLLLSDSPVIRWIQVVILLAVLLDIYLVFYVVRDILLRTNSFLLQVLCILLAGALPVIGFLAYLLVRPSRTIKEREMEQLLHQLLEGKKEARTAQKHPKHASKPVPVQEPPFEEAAI